MGAKKISRSDAMTTISWFGMEIFIQADSYFKLSKPISLNNKLWSPTEVSRIVAVDVDTMNVYVQGNGSKKEVVIPMSALRTPILVQLSQQIARDCNELTKKRMGVE